MSIKQAILYDYWRSSACYRLRIALNLLNINYEIVQVNLLKQENLTNAHLARNHQGLVPALLLDGIMMTQSLSIIEYLHETHENSTLLPNTPIQRQQARALAYLIAMDIHPVCNLRVAAHVVELTGDETQRKKWIQKFILTGLAAFEAMLADFDKDYSTSPDFIFGKQPTIVEICLVPQIFNAQRWEVDLSAMPRLMHIYHNCQQHPAFIKAVPQPPQ